jgi:hypothetical protein
MPDNPCHALPGALARPDWQPGGEFTAAALRLEQKYRIQRLRRHLRLVHGWGIVCGLTVVSANREWELCVCPGYGIGPCGDEILVSARYCFNLADYLWTRPVGVPARRVWIGIEARENQEDWETAPSSSCGCGCSGSDAEASRSIDGFRIVVAWKPFVFAGRSFDVCKGGTPPCPPCPETCALPLAVVTLPSAFDPILGSAIGPLEDF